MGTGSMIGRKKEAAVGALLVHRTIEDAAKAVGVSSKTLQRWQKKPEFKAAYQAARQEALGQCMARLQQASSAAVSTLLKVMVDPTAPAGSRVRAADCVLTHAGVAVVGLESSPSNPQWKSASPDLFLTELSIASASETIRALQESEAYREEAEDGESNSASDRESD
jgi:hypothetical protein